MGEKGGLQVLDVAVLARLADTGFSEFPVGGSVYGKPWPQWDIAVAGEYAYVAAAEAALCIVDILPSPLPPAEVGFYETLGLASDMAVGLSPASAAVAGSMATEEQGSRWDKESGTLSPPHPRHIQGWQRMARWRSLWYS